MMHPIYSGSTIFKNVKIFKMTKKEYIRPRIDKCFQKLYKFLKTNFLQLKKYMNMTRKRFVSQQRCI